MESLPFEIQELIYRKAMKLQFDDCLKHIKQAHNAYYQRLFSKIEKEKYASHKYWKELQHKRITYVKYMTIECWGREWQEVDLSIW